MKKKPAKAKKPAPKKASASKTTTKKPQKSEWGAGPWAVPAKPATPKVYATVPMPRPDLEDVFNHKVSQNYGLKSPLSPLRTPRGVWLVRGILIAVAVGIWLFALLHGK
ncbi:MAG TPA: hypothetical protein VHP58_05105 [Alphaproteobacteria bacterium]|nr:hypothetical protein [Alphaproteobacteria bacterium]